MKKAFMILGLVIFIVAAALLVIMQPASKSVPSVTAPVSVVPVSFTTLAQGPQSKVTDRVDYLVTSQDQLDQLWSFLEEPPPVPVVDFNTNVVAGVFAGKVPSTGYAIAVAAVEDAANRLVKVQLVKPDGSCKLSHATTTPYQIIELPKTSLPFTHDDIWTTKPCN